jgi:hypothetical protein
MKISQNFDVREFVPKHIYDAFGENSTWFVNPKAVRVAEFYKAFFTTYFKNKMGNDKVKTVLVMINNWHTGGQKQWSGLRTAKCTEGAENSQHRYMNAFDCELIVVMSDGSQKEVDYKEIHQVIKDNEKEFMANGVTRLEDVSIANGWLHTDFAWVYDQKNILIVKPK